MRYLVHYKLHIPKFYCHSKAERKSERDINKKESMCERPVHSKGSSVCLLTTLLVRQCWRDWRRMAQQCVPIKRSNTAAQKQNEKKMFRRSIFISERICVHLYMISKLIWTFLTNWNWFEPVIYTWIAMDISIWNRPLYITHEFYSNICIGTAQTKLFKIWNEKK